VRFIKKPEISRKKPAKKSKNSKSFKKSSEITTGL
jgi:hypothetical protein